LNLDKLGTVFLPGLVSFEQQTPTLVRCVWELIE